MILSGMEPRENLWGRCEKGRRPRRRHQSRR
nr:MAG TPA: hypothetical protein [Caudoviricetes sp.]